LFDDYNHQVTALNNEIKQTKACIRKMKDLLYKLPHFAHNENINTHRAVMQKYKS